MSVRASRSLLNIKPAMRLATDYGDTMTRHISLAAIILCISACASTGPDAPAPAAADAVASDISSDPPGSVIHDPNAPVVHVSASASAASDSDEIVCRREKQTGSRMTVRVCRTRAEIDARAEKDKESLRQSRASQSGSDCALNGNC